MIELLVSGVVAAVVFILCMVLVTSMSRESTSKRIKRLAPSVEETEEIVDRTRDERSTGLASVLEPILKLLFLRPGEFRRMNFYRFYRAGIDPVDGPIYYLAWKVFVTPLAILACIAFWEPSDDILDTLLQFIVCGIMLILAWAGPNLYVSNKRAKREKIISRSFPDALDLLLVCTESGLALDGALARVTRELHHAHPMITDELNKTRMELTMLNDRERALQNLAERVDLVAMRSLVAALLQTERFGTSLVETLRVLADEYRTTRLMLAEQKAGRLPVMITIPLILLMMPAFFLIIMGPAIIKAIPIIQEVPGQ